MKQRRREIGPEVTPQGEAILIPEHVSRFMNSLPVTFNPIAWLNQFREALRELLGDVDKVAVFINTGCAILDPPVPQIDNDRKSIVWQLQHEAQPDDLNVLVTFGTNEMLDRHFQHMKQLGFPFDEYAPPHSFTYYLHNDNKDAYLGLILLFRRLDAQPVSAQTLDTMEQLRPFLLFALSSLVARSNYLLPASHIFRTTVGHLCYRIDLTDREREVLHFRLMGFQIDDIARKMYLSRDAIKKHIKAIHRKTGGASVWQLFIQYLEPEIDNESLLTLVDMAYEAAQRRDPL